MSSGLAALTLFHGVISLVGILTGFVVIYGLLTAQRLHRWTNVFLITTVATSLTGYLFPFHKLLPAPILSVLSLIALAVAIYAYYLRRLAGGWRRAYAITAVLAQYFNVFVPVAQMFMKIPGAESAGTHADRGPVQSGGAFRAHSVPAAWDFQREEFFSRTDARSLTSRDPQSEVNDELLAKT